MGNVIFKVILNNQSLNGVAIVANAPYVITGEQIAGSDHNNKKLSEAILQPIISPEQSTLMSGGGSGLG